MSSINDPIEELRPKDLTPARSLRERAGVVIALSTLVFIDLVMKTAGFDRFYRMIRAWRTFENRSEGPEAIQQTCAAVDRAATYYLKRTWCLQRSATTVCLLRSRGVRAQLVIGIQKLPFYAHAWVEVEGRVVNDHPFIQRKYTVLERC